MERDGFEKRKKCVAAGRVGKGLAREARRRFPLVIYTH